MPKVVWNDPSNATISGNNMSFPTLQRMAVRYQTTVSGQVRDSNGNPLVREVRLYRQAEWTKMDTSGYYAKTTSSAVDGSYTFVVAENSDRFEWVIVCLGEANENILVYSHVNITA